MRRKDFNAPIRAIWGLILGLILCLYPDNVGSYLVILLGLIFMVPSAISILVFLTQIRKTKVIGSRTFPIVSTGCLLFGTWLVISPSNFVQMLTVIIGLLIIIGSVQQLYGLQLAKQWTNISGIHYFIPIILLVSGIIVILNPIGVISGVMTFAGIVLLIYSLNELIRFFILDVNKPTEPEHDSNDENKENENSGDTDIQDIDFEETKENE